MIKKMKFRGWTVEYCPMYGQDWQYFHEDYDGVEDGNVHLAGNCSSIEECIEEILDCELEALEVLLNQEAMSEL